jgi:outer membrane protein OmpA-like peptidoglycan-associated protein
VDLNLDNFLAILRFDYNSSQISDENKELLKQLSTRLPNGATIQILGSTDELGTPQRNAILAKERAENTRNYIQSISKDKFIIEIGTNYEKFPEATPQGRFLNRSIRIKVKK